MNNKKCAYRDPVCLSGMLPLILGSIAVIIVLLYLTYIIIILPESDPLWTFAFLVFAPMIYFSVIAHTSRLLFAVYYKLPIEDMEYDVDSKIYPYLGILIALIGGAIGIIYWTSLLIIDYKNTFSTVFSWAISIKELLIFVKDIIFSLSLYPDISSTMILATIVSIILILVVGYIVSKHPKIVDILIEKTLRIFMFPFTFFVYVGNVIGVLYQRACMSSCRSNESLLNMVYQKDVLKKEFENPLGYMLRVSKNWSDMPDEDVDE